MSQFRMEFRSRQRQQHFGLESADFVSALRLAFAAAFGERLLRACRAGKRPRERPLHLRQLPQERHVALASGGGSGGSCRGKGEALREKRSSPRLGR